MERSVVVVAALWERRSSGDLERENKCAGKGIVGTGNRRCKPHHLGSLFSSRETSLEPQNSSQKLVGLRLICEEVRLLEEAGQITRALKPGETPACI